MGQSSINGPFSMALLNNQKVYIFLSSWYTCVLITKSVEPSLRVETLDDLSPFFWSNIQNYWALPCSGFSFFKYIYIHIIPLSNIKNPKALCQNNLVLECVGIHLGGLGSRASWMFGKGISVANFLPMSFDRTASGSQKPKRMKFWGRSWSPIL